MSKLRGMRSKIRELEAENRQLRQLVKDMRSFENAFHESLTYYATTGLLEQKIYTYLFVTWAVGKQVDDRMTKLGIGYAGADDV